MYAVVTCIVTFQFVVERGTHFQHAGFHQRSIVVEVFHSTDSDVTRSYTDRVVIPEDSVVKYVVKPDMEDSIITVRVSAGCIALACR